ncbi:MAG: hypothetical protein KDK70_08480 [Myxococcales bacterium]|nr:hypothetical protein [Myxococcales bacterium]
MYAQPPQRGQGSNDSSESEPAKSPSTHESARRSGRASSGDRATKASAHRAASTRRSSSDTEGARTEPVGERTEPVRVRTEPVRVAMRATARAATDATAATTADAAAAAPTADAAPTSETESADPTPSTRRDRGRGRPPGGRTVIEDDFLVEGKLEKPSAYYILRRSSLDYDWARLDAKFSPLVLESVQDPLF